MLQHAVLDKLSNFDPTSDQDKPRISTLIQLPDFLRFIRPAMVVESIVYCRSSTRVAAVTSSNIVVVSRLPEVLCSVLHTLAVKHQIKQPIKVQSKQISKSTSPLVPSQLQRDWPETMQTAPSRRELRSQNGLAH